MIWNDGDRFRIIGTDVTGTIGDDIVYRDGGYVTGYFADGGRRVLHTDNLERV